MLWFEVVEKSIGVLTDLLLQILYFLCSFEEVYSFWLKFPGFWGPHDDVFLTAVVILQKLDSELCFLALLCDVL